MHKKDLIFLIAFAVLATLVPLILPIIEGRLLASLDSPDWLVLRLAGIIFLIVLLSELSGLFFDLFSSKLTTALTADIKFSIVSSLPKIKTKALSSIPTGLFTARISEDAGKLSDIYISMIRNLLGVISNLAFLIFIFLISAWLGLFVAVSMVIIIIMEWVRILFLSKGKAKIFLQKEKTDSATNEIVFGAKEVKILGVNSSTLSKVSEELNSEREVVFKEGLKQTIFSRVIAALVGLIGFFFIMQGKEFIDNNMLSISAFLIVYLYRMRTGDFLGNIVQIKSMFSQGEIISKRIFDVIQGEKRFPKEEFGTKQPTKTMGEVVFQRVSFAFNKKPVLDNVSLKILPKSVTVFEGLSGSGKTTILSLIARLFDVSSGRILIDKVDIKELSEDALKSAVSFVTEEPFFFSGSVKENLKLANPDAEFADLVSACKLAQIHDFISSLPKAYDTEISEQSLLFSSGERQRLAIARTLLKNSKILLFDEIMNNLDEENRRLVGKAIKSISKTKTIIIVCHAKEAIDYANNIYEIKEGKIRRKRRMNNDNYN